MTVSEIKKCIYQILQIYRILFANEVWLSFLICHVNIWFLLSFIIILYIGPLWFRLSNTINRH